MDADARAIKDIGRVLLFAAAYTLAFIAYYISKLLSSGTGWVPFVGGAISGAVDDALVKPAKRLMDDASTDIAKGLSGLVDEAAIWVGLALLLGLGVKDALAYLWKHSLPAYVLSQTAGIVKKVETLIGRVNAVPGQIADAFASAYRDAAKLADAAYASATGYADAAVHDAVAMLRHELGTAVGDLRAAEDAAVTKAMQVAADGVTAAEHYTDAAVAALGADLAAKWSQAQTLVAAGVSEAEAFATAGISAAEKEALAAVTSAGTAAAAALAATAAGFTSALGEVKSIAVTAEQEIGTVLGDLAPGDAAALIASIPLLATLVHTLATETGLENQACRQKIKGVCGTDPNQWANLLGGLAALGIAFNLRQLYEVAQPLVGGLADVIREAA